ncbi:9807_t:CDS:2, partial [Funneliformis mosseae]
TLRLRAKWINNSATFCVRSTECSTYIDGINKNSPFYQYCKNANIMELLEYFNDPEDCTPKFWNQLARMRRASAFKDKQIFSGLCEIFVKITNLLPFVLEIISNNSKNISDVYEIHNQVLNLTAYFKIHILSIGVDSTSIEIKVQKNIMQTNTEMKLEFIDELY